MTAPATPSSTSSPSPTSTSETRPRCNLRDFPFDDRNQGRAEAHGWQGLLGDCSPAARPQEVGPHHACQRRNGPRGGRWPMGTGPGQGSNKRETLVDILNDGNDSGEAVDMRYTIDGFWIPVLKSTPNQHTLRPWFKDGLFKKKDFRPSRKLLSLWTPKSLTSPLRKMLIRKTPKFCLFRLRAQSGRQPLRSKSPTKPTPSTSISRQPNRLAEAR